MFRPRTSNVRWKKNNKIIKKKAENNNKEVVDDKAEYYIESEIYIYCQHLNHQLKTILGSFKDTY